MPAVVGIALQALPLIVDVISAWGRGATQEEIDAKWAKVRDRVLSANDAWEQSKENRGQS